VKLAVTSQAEPLTESDVRRVREGIEDCAALLRMTKACGLVGDGRRWVGRMGPGPWSGRACSARTRP
jgi:hypothetical protein